MTADFDLTGSQILASRPLAVFCGSVWTSISKTYMGDHLLEHLLPVNVWGTEFITVPIATRLDGDVFRIMGKLSAIEHLFSTYVIRMLGESSDEVSVTGQCLGN